MIYLQIKKLLKKIHKPLFSLGGLSKERYLDMLYKQSTYFYLAQCYSAYSHLRKKQPVNWKSRYNTKSVGIKDFFVNVKQDNLYNYFLDSKEISIIHLKRSNILKRLISAMLMHQAGVVSTTENSTENKSFEIDIDQLLAKLKRDYELNEEENAFAAKLSKKQPFYQLSYEQLNTLMKITSRVLRAHQNIIRKFLISLALKVLKLRASIEKFFPKISQILLQTTMILKEHSRLQNLSSTFIRILHNA